METETGSRNKVTGWFLLFLGFVIGGLPFASYFYDVIWMLVARRPDRSHGGSSIGFAIALPFILLSWGFLTAGWTLLLQKKNFRILLIIPIILSFSLPIPVSYLYLKNIQSYGSISFKVYDKYRNFETNALASELDKRIDASNFYYAMTLGQMGLGVTIEEIKPIMQLIKEKSGAASLPVFERILKRSKCKEIQMLALNYIAPLDKEKALPALENIIKSSHDRGWRGAAMGLYSELQKAKAVPLLIEVLNSENDFEKAFDIVYQLRNSLDKADELQKAKAIEALRKFKHKFRHYWFFFPRKLSYTGSDFKEWISAVIVDLYPPSRFKEKTRQELIKEECSIEWQERVKK